MTGWSLAEPWSCASTTADEGPGRRKNPRADLAEIPFAQESRGGTVVELRVQALKPSPCNRISVVLGDQPSNMEREPQSFGNGLPRLPFSRAPLAHGTRFAHTHDVGHKLGSEEIAQLLHEYRKSDANRVIVGLKIRSGDI